MDKADIAHLAEEIKGLFAKKMGRFRRSDLIDVLKDMGIEAWDKDKHLNTGKMFAKNHLADIIGINLQYALRTYEWVDITPMSDDGLTVSGFWDKKDYVDFPEGYVMDDSGDFLTRSSE